MTINTTYHSLKHSINTVHISVVFLFLHYISIDSHSNSLYETNLNCLVLCLLYTQSLYLLYCVLLQVSAFSYTPLLSPGLSHCLLHSYHTISVFRVLIHFSIHNSVSVSSIFWVCILYILVLYSIFWFSIFSVSLNMCLLGPPLISISTILLSSLFYILGPVYYLIFIIQSLTPVFWFCIFYILVLYLLSLNMCLLGPQLISTRKHYPSSKRCLLV